MYPVGTCGKLLKINPNLKFLLRQQCKTYPDVKSFNVIAEIKGSEFPDEIILVGGHLDSWDIGDGSHDDGAGCVQSMDVLRLLKLSGITPKRSIRVVLFMNEENGLRGGKKYAEEAFRKGENHIFALESDAASLIKIFISFALASIEFSSNSFTTEAGLCTTSPAAIWLATFSGKILIMSFIN